MYTSASNLHVYSPFAVMPGCVFALSNNSQCVRQHHLCDFQLRGTHQKIVNRFILTVLKIHICETAVLIISVLITSYLDEKQHFQEEWYTLFFPQLFLASSPINSFHCIYAKITCLIYQI